MKFSLLSPKTFQQWVGQGAIFSVGLLLYAAILSIGIPEQISRLLLSEDSLLFFLGSLVFLYFAYLAPGWLGTLTSFSGTLTIFAIQLSGVWKSGVNLSAYILSGLMTMTETAGYYSSALNLLEGGNFQVVAAWRPLAHSFLSTLLGLTQQNFQITLALLVLTTAIASYCLAREIQRSQGNASAVLVLMIIFMYYRVYLGTASTESLGLALGALGLACIWRGAINIQSRPVLMGIFFVTFALNIRAGAFFILPALIIWGALLFRGQSRFSARFVLGSLSLILLGFLLNSLIFKLTAPPDAASFSNFSYSFYGLLVNGNWQTIFRDHPELLELPDQEASKRIYQIIFEILRQDPLSLVRGVFRAWKIFIWDDFIFDFVATSKTNNAKINVGLQLLSIIGLITAYRQRRTPIGSLILATSLGIFLSVPFVPPWDAGMRPYMATVPFIAILPSLGLTALGRKMQWQPIAHLPSVKESPFLLWLVGGIIVFLTIGGGIFIKVFSQPPNFANITCPSGTEAVYFRNTSGSSIEILANNAIRQTKIPKVRIHDFQRMLDYYQKRYGRHTGLAPLIEVLSSISEPTTMTAKINLTDGELLWVVRSNPIEHEGIIGSCGKFAADRNTQNLDEIYLRLLFFSDSETPVS